MTIVNNALSIPNAKEVANYTVTPPPGLMGDIARFIYDAAPRPVAEVALTGAIGLMAGICGRAFNISTTGLNLYCLMLAHTGTCYLYYNNWNDFGFVTSFNTLFFDENGNQHDLGIVKIMHLGLESGQTTLPDEFKTLPKEYCSVGNGREYYAELSKLSPQIRKEYLSALRDCVSNHKIWKKFADEKAMQSSLLRDVSRQDVLYNFPRILQGHAELTPYSFSFKFDAGIKEKNICEFTVRPDSKPPSNIHVLIGRNGVGKTRLLAGITRKVFGLEVEQSGFYKLLKDSSTSKDFDEIMEDFEEEIGAEGRALVRSFIVQRDNE